jgi:hypothetical protein
MKRKWQITVAAVLSLAILLTAVPAVMAQDDEPEPTASLTGGGSLAIIAPWTVPAGKEFTVRAFLRGNQEPFPNAGIWAIRQNADGTLKEDLSWLREDANQTDDNLDYESILDTHGVFLGRTGRDGRLACTFDEAGRYILVAARNGYRPGFTHIGIRETVKALGIRAPKRAPAGRPVTMMVFDRVIHEPVQGAGVWAVTRDNIDMLQQEAEALKQDASLADEEKDYESLANTYGFFLGRTDENGKLEYAFEETGTYLLVAVKRGYYPGFSLISIVDLPQALGIKATPPRTHVGREVTLSVFDRSNNDPVEGAGVWAIGRDEAATLRDEIEALRKDNSTDAAETDYESIVSLYGTFLGRTDEHGKLGATFDTAGFYVLVAIKRGYLPGVTTLVVKEAPELQSQSVKPESTRIQKEPITEIN